MAKVFLSLQKWSATNVHCRFCYTQTQAFQNSWLEANCKYILDVLHKGPKPIKIWLAHKTVGLKNNFGGIPNSSSLVPCLTTWAHSCSAVVLPVWTMLSPKGVQKQSHGCSCQGCKATNHTGTLLNLPQHWNSPEPSGTFRKLPPEPTPANTGTLRNLLEPSSGTCSCDPHRHTPELIWAEDPISLRCWGNTQIPLGSKSMGAGPGSYSPPLQCHW